MSRSSEKLHHLDLGVARFTEFSITVILTDNINADFYQSKLKELATSWPILQTRLDRLRSHLLYSSTDRMHVMWGHTNISSLLSSKLPEYAKDDLPISIDCSRLDEYFQLTTMTALLAPRRVTKQAVFRLQVVQFMDAAVLKFTVQHPLCDAKGLHKIVSAYCDLLAGKKITAINPRTPLDMLDETKESEDTGEFVEPPIEASADMKESEKTPYFSKGWGPFLMSGVSQWTRRSAGSNRVSKAVLVPLPVMMHWRSTANSMKIKVSRNDLLMAWIYMCSVPKAGKDGLKFTFVLNVEQFLDSTGDLHNPWCLVPVSAPDAVTNRIFTSPNQIETLIHLARYFREVIEQARTPEFVRKSLKDHADAPVITPKGFGKSEPDIRVSSWSYIDLWALQFPTGPRPYNRGEVILKPRWIAGNIDLCPALMFANLTCDDTLVTWNEERGYWIQGRLHQEVWERIAQSSALVLLDQRSQPF